MEVVGEPSVVIRFQRKNLVFSLVFSVALVAAGAPAVLSTRHDVVAGLSAVAVFALIAVLSAVIMIRPPELLRFGPDGIREGRGPFRSPAQLIPWSDIQAVRIFPYRLCRLGQQQRRLGIVPRNPANQRWTTWRRRNSTKTFGLPVTISERDVRNRRLDIIADQMRALHPTLPTETGKLHTTGLITGLISPFKR